MAQSEQGNMDGQHTPEELKQFTVIGSGVIGLLTANELAEQGHAVTVISDEGQPKDGTHSTSSIAIGQFLPWLPAEHAAKTLGNLEGGIETVVIDSAGYYAELAHNPHETGVMQIRNVELLGPTEWPKGLPTAMRVEEKALEDPIELTGPDGGSWQFTREYDFDTYSINTPKTVVWLADQAAKKGVKFERAHVTAEQLAQLQGVVVNATGMGAQELTGAEDVEHFKGHTIVIRPAEGKPFPTEAVSAEDLIIMPREDGTVVVGALYRSNPETPVPAQDEALELKTRLTELTEKAGNLIDGLDTSLFTDGEVLYHSGGYRVEITSDEGIRVAPDENLEHVLHAYGFAGIGWSVGPTFAKRIAAQAVEMHNNIKEK